MSASAIARSSLLILGLLLTACGTSGSSSDGLPTSMQVPSAMESVPASAGGDSSIGPASSNPSNSGPPTIGGIASGLIGAGLVLQLNGGSDLPVTANGVFEFSTTIASSSQYTVTVGTQPSNPSQTCVLSNATGTGGGSAISNVVLTCTSSPGRFAYVGTHAGIFCYAIDAIGGGLSPLETPQCDSGVLTAVATDPTGQFVYATDSAAGTIRAYQIDSSTGALVRLGGSDVPVGLNPVSIAVDSKGRFVYVGNYGSDSVSAYTINAATGALAAAPGSPFPTGHLPNSVSIDPSGAFLYTANNGSSDVSGFSIDAVSGALTPVPGSPFAVGVAMSVAIDPTGKFAFVANLDTANVSAFTIERGTGTLSPVPGSPFSAGCSPPVMLSAGCSPSSVAVDASGAFLYVTDDNTPGSISGYSIDPTTGALALLTASPFASAVYAYSATAHGTFLYVSNNDAVGSVSTFSIDAQGGGLVQITGSPVGAAPAGSTTGTYGLAIAP